MTDAPPATVPVREYISDKVVLLVISGGLIAILLSIVIGLLRAKVELPNWAENVFVSIATAAALKLGDCLSTLVALSSGRQVERLGTQLAGTVPAETLPSTDAPAGTEEDPLHVAGATSSDAPPVQTEDAATPGKKKP